MANPSNNRITIAYPVQIVREYNSAVDWTDDKGQPHHLERRGYQVLFNDADGVLSIGFARPASADVNCSGFSGNGRLVLSHFDDSFSTGRDGRRQGGLPEFVFTAFLPDKPGK